MTHCKYNDRLTCSMHGWCGCSEFRLLPCPCSLLQVTVENVIRVLTGKTSGLSIHSVFTKIISLSYLSLLLASPPKTGFSRSP